MDRHCPHCDPLVRDRRHVVERIDKFLAPIAERLSSFESFLRRILHIRNSWFIRFFRLIGIIKEIDPTDDGHFFNRSLVVVREAKKRGIEIQALTLFGRSTQQFVLRYRGREVFFTALPHLLVDDVVGEHLDNKWELKKALERHGMPHPKGLQFYREEEGLKYVRETIGFPVVVKPSTQSLSLHVTCNIASERELVNAIRRAQQLDRNVIVEEYIDGDVFRATVVGGRVVAVCRRDPPSVMGDGMHRIAQLIEIKNSDITRGDRLQKNYTLHKIALTDGVRSRLSEQRLSMESIPEKGERIFLHSKLILACGADIEDVTDIVHRDNKTLFSQVAALCTSPLIGIDFIAKDISKPHFDQKCGVIEINSVPYIDMHHYPTTGKPRDVAGPLLDHVLSTLN